ncbi:D-3-phosphoglycerate dehydrogenase [Kineosporia sp. NBRC 101677]|uniref:phosphoglycerate dehydrogenase n=1 Tax=Kineosporia sp. NBRC 101677 TaxID=3032197 RepID=UPI0024A3F51A|nr:phosphoglycerate dehydrogenase [Kineosporia sp. NBRC 101677]GLY17102.1 D-3-phosphoglycerate dehydrogenase [Kineosporia sp. NBRC 101677]
MSGKPRALLLEGIHPSAVEVLEQGGYEVDLRAGSLAESELAEALPGVELLGIRSNTSVGPAALAAATDLKALGCFCIGTNQVDLEAAADRALPVFNAPYSNSRSVVELVIGEIIALSRRLMDKNRLLHAGIWDKSARGSHEVRGRTLGVVGYGNIGTQLSNVAEAIGMRVVFFDVADRPAHGNAQRMPSLQALLQRADVVSLHVDGRPGNAGLFGAAEFAAMKAGSLFVNASRGMVVDDVALRANIESGHLAGAALDVFPIEPKRQGDAFESGLRGLENVILTPHVAASTLEAQEEIGWFVAGKLLRYVRDGSTGLAVNVPNVQAAAGEPGHVLTLLHRNVPGVMADLNQELQSAGFNITSQALSTAGSLGYVVTGLDKAADASIRSRIAALPAAIDCRTPGA